MKSFLKFLAVVGPLVLCLAQAYNIIKYPKSKSEQKIELVLRKVIIEAQQDL